MSADDYHVTVDLVDDVLTFDIAAGEDACEDCLTPPAILERIIRSLLSESGIEPKEVVVKYPPKTS
ncbi:hypothetical protein [Nocardioides sp. WS12]|uniref:hypothetical protein n=1 Tax=Nocardioides sp. WS12 TaxID=2486272 RepID=UPI0015FD9A73|nr:hypothetical protein [Nocardioides sp. WS12]